jgi:long-chain acyl-CoA synthetase
MNLVSIVEDHPADAVALISRRTRTTYGELREQVAGLRGGLAGLGLEPGDRVGILCANNWYFVVSYLAILGSGMVAVPLNPLSPAPEIQRQLAAVTARAVVVGPSGRPTMANLDRGAVPTLEHVIAAHGVVLPDAVDLDDLVAVAPQPVVERADDDLAVLIFTSGTAGSPKAAMLSHGNLRANFAQTDHTTRERSDDVILGIVPLYHILGLNGVLV